MLSQVNQEPVSFLMLLLYSYYWDLIYYRQERVFGVASVLCAKQPVIFYLNDACWLFVEGVFEKHPYPSRHGITNLLFGHLSTRWILLRAGTNYAWHAGFHHIHHVSNSIKMGKITHDSSSLCDEPVDQGRNSQSASHFANSHFTWCSSI